MIEEDGREQPADPDEDADTPEVSTTETEQGADVQDQPEYVRRVESLLDGFAKRFGDLEDRLKAVEEDSRELLSQWLTHRVQDDDNPTGESADPSDDSHENHTEGPTSEADETEPSTDDAPADLPGASPDELPANDREPDTHPEPTAETVDELDEAQEMRDEGTDNETEGPETADGDMEEELPEEPEPEPEPWSPEALLDEIWEQEEDGTEQDSQAYELAVVDAQAWNERRGKLIEGISDALEIWNRELEQSVEIKDGFSGDLQEKLAGRHYGLELTVKMLTRLLEHHALPRPDQSVEPGEFPEPPSKEELLRVISSQEHIEMARRAADKKLSPVRDARYQLVADARAHAHKLSKGFLGFIEKQVLPVIDGLDEGEKHSSQLVDSLQSDDPDQRDKLEEWIRTYEKMREALLLLLEDVGVRQMAVVVHEPIDYDRHVPFDMEEDPALNTEDIKDVSRNGYEYSAGEEGQYLVLRPAQVIVVKNPAGA